MFVPKHSKMIDNLEEILNLHSFLPYVFEIRVRIYVLEFPDYQLRLDSCGTLDFDNSGISFKSSTRQH